MNLKKTEVMFNKNTTPQAIEVNGIKLEEVSNYVYLGQLVLATENQMCEISRRAKMGWSAFGRLSMVLKGKLPLCLKRKVFNQCVLPVLTYGCETWTLNAKMTKKLQTTQQKRKEWIRVQTKVCNVIR
ncbi:UNVERIFIED_CONTAM: hypothetical protein FKN15_055638 [Acipenser sinensis]